ncbi:hypothetical protein [Dyadobacter sp. NIV53]|uniref:hypothetical protein n=1 Tax=Dyadobacter sp. NIV53 TaxID=2861765 RepID=UPI001C888FDD|nr:hypothetical protein [Dyadobacter sp. NIV53]
MKKIFFVAAILALGFTNANAQYDSRYDHRDNRDNNYPQYPNGRDDYERGGDSEINHLQREARQRIDAGFERRTLSRREADVLMREYRRIENLERKFSHRGRLSNREARILRSELQRLMADTHRMSSRRGNDWARERGRY